MTSCLNEPRLSRLTLRHGLPEEQMNAALMKRYSFVEYRLTRFDDETSVHSPNLELYRLLERRLFSLI